MKSSVLRQASALVLAGTVVLGASACTSVSSSGSKSSAAGSASAAASGASDKASSASDSPSSSDSSSSSSDSSSSSSDSGSSDSSDSGGSGSGLVTGKVGQEVSTDYYTAKVNKITDNAKSSDDYETPKSGTRFVDVNVTVKNKDKNKLSMSDGYLEAQLSDDTQIEGSYTSGIGSDIGFKDLYSGDTITGDIVFEVPQGKQIKTLTFKPISIERTDDQVVRISVN